MKKMLQFTVALTLIALISTSCNNSKSLKPDTPTNTAWLMKIAIDNKDYDKFNELFSEGRKNVVSKDMLSEFNKITTAGSSYTHYELVTFENGEMLLVRLTPEKIDGKYKIEDVVKVPGEMKKLFETK